MSGSSRKKLRVLRKLQEIKCNRAATSLETLRKKTRDIKREIETLRADFAELSSDGYPPQAAARRLVWREVKLRELNVAIAKLRAEELVATSEYRKEFGRGLALERLLENSG